MFNSNYNELRSMDVKNTLRENKVEKGAGSEVEGW